MKAVVFTLGCKVNFRESASIMEGLKQRGYEVSEDLSYADLFVINTCAVTAEAEKKSRQAIARVRKYNPLAKVIVCGCASENNAKSFNDKNIFALIGAKNKDKIFDLLDNGGTYIEKQDFYYDKYLPCKTQKIREFIKIQDGCDNFCSYCIIPYLRGRSRSRDMYRIKEEIDYLNPLEAVLTGINISDYKTENGNLVDLLNLLKSEKCRIRFGSLEESIISEDFLVATKKLFNFAPHFHLSLQSGSDKVLKTMNRHYSTEEFYEKVKLIRDFYPNCAITTDVIVGYSTESDEDFIDSYDFCKKVEFADIHCFSYSVRKGTVGAKLKPIDDETKKNRLKKFLTLKEELKHNYNKNFIGKKLTLIVEETIDGYEAGYSENYIRLYLKEKTENIVDVIAVSEFKDGLLCKKL